MDMWIFYNHQSLSYYMSYCKLVKLFIHILMMSSFNAIKIYILLIDLQKYRIKITAVDLSHYGLP